MKNLVKNLISKAITNMAVLSLSGSLLFGLPVQAQNLNNIVGNGKIGSSQTPGSATLQESIKQQHSFGDEQANPNPTEYKFSLPIVKLDFNHSPHVFTVYGAGYAEPLTEWQTNIPLISCAQQCKGNSQCQSFLYVRNFQACQLLPDTIYTREMYRGSAQHKGQSYHIDYFGSISIENQLAAQKQIQDGLSSIKRQQAWQQAGQRVDAGVVQNQANMLSDLQRYTQAVSNGTYLNQYANQSTSRPPKLNMIWTSSYGDINFLGGTYGNEGQRIFLTTPVWSATEQAYEAVAHLKSSGEAHAHTYVKFVFSSECTFSARIKRQRIEDFIWNGQCNDDAAQQTALNQQRQQQELQETANLQRQQQQQEAERVNALSKPKLFGQWTSTYGDIHWEQNWYGEENNIIIMQEPYWDQNRQAWVAQGNYGKHNSSNQGNLEFVFNDACSFTGAWWPQGSSTRTEWTGSCAAPASTVVAATNPAANNTANTIAATGPQKPNLSALWSSSYGDINWAGGWYGEVNNFLSPGVIQWDDGFNAYVVNGYWGRRDGVQNAGGFTFIFNGPCAFTGEWWYNSKPNERNQWTGQCK